MFLVDSHCHLDMLEEDTRQVIDRAKTQGVQYILNVCVSVADFPQVLATAENYPFVGASFGLHPNETAEEVSEEEIILRAQPDKVIAIGETGLDYYRTTGDTAWQSERFRRHIRAAKRLNKPLIIHTRAAKEDTLRIMREEKASEVGAVMHCFTEDWEMAKQALDEGFYISISGIVTFKNATTIQDVAKRVPLDRLMVETDSPYLAPIPFRGKPNEPGFVRHTAEFIANLRNESLEQLAAQTTENFFTLFKGALRPHV